MIKSFYIFLFLIATYTCAVAQTQIGDTINSVKSFKAESFLFKTKGEARELLNINSFNAVMQAAKAAGYNEDEIEITIEAKNKPKKPEKKSVREPAKVKRKKFE